MIKRRRRFKQHLSLQDRLSAWAYEVREQANKLQPGPKREMLINKARQADAAARLDEWMNSPGLQPSR
jgi:hypothetical protein